MKPTTQISARPVVPIAPKPAVSEKAPDFSLLNKPPPIPFYLPKAAALAPRTVSSDPLNEPPEIALKKLEAEATTLKEEVAALKWLAKRKEQEWNNIVELLKKKEETWIKVKRHAELAATDKAFQKMSTVIQSGSIQPTLLSSSSTVMTFTTNSSSSASNFNSNPVMPEPPPPIQIRVNQTSTQNKTIVSNSASVINLPSTAGSNQRKVLVPVSQPLTPQTIEQLKSQGLLKSGGLTADGKRIIVVKKSATGTTILPRSLSSSSTPTTIMMASRTAAGQTPTVTKVVMANSLRSPITATGQIKKNPTCQECKIKPSKFECAGCSKMWYCSRECQEKNWPKHEEECGQTKTVVKQEIIDELID